MSSESASLAATSPRALLAGGRAGAVLLAALFFGAGSVLGAGGPGNAAGHDALQLICLTEQPAIVEGERASLKAWVSTAEGRPVNPPPRFEWSVEAGSVEGQAAFTRWDLSFVRARPLSNPGPSVATVRASVPGRGELKCSVQVFIGAAGGTTPDRGTLRGHSLISAKRFLLPSESEEPGYGLYSYLLFSAPPHGAEEEARYLKTIEACLLVLKDLGDYLGRHVRPKELNATFIPLTRPPDESGASNAQWAANVLAVYDYAAAKILLRSVNRDKPGGPFLLSMLKPPSEAVTNVHLWEDLSGVSPELAWNWVQHFEFLSAQQRTWSEATLERLGLTLRNLLAVGSKIVPGALRRREGAIQFEVKL